MNVGELLISTSDVSLCSCRSWRHAWRNIRAMIFKLWREVHIGDAQVLAIDELLEVVAHEMLHLDEGHASLGVFVLCNRVHDASPRVVFRRVSPRSESYP